MPTKQNRRESINQRNVRRYNEVLQGVADVFAKKNADYNEGAALQDYFPFGMTSYAQMLHVKTQRVVALTKTGSAVQNESIGDSLRDLINYATFALIHLEDQENEPV